MSAIKLCDLFRGESIRSDNGSEVGMPIFGRYAAIVRVGDLRIYQGDDENWIIGLPMGVTIVGDRNQQQALAEAQALAAGGNVYGWVTDRALAVETAIAEARERHNFHAARSGGYRKKFGDVIEH